MHAEWDGSSLTGSTGLLQLAELAVAVDQAFVEAGLAEGARRRAGLSEQEQLMLALVTCCDAVHVAEYVVAGHRYALGAARGR